MLPEPTIFNLKTLNFVKNRSVLVNFENIIFMGVGLSDFRGDKWKNRDKTGKMLNFLGLSRGIFTVCP